MKTRWPYSAGAGQHELHVIFSNPTIPCGAMALEFTIHWDGLIFNMLYGLISPELLYYYGISDVLFFLDFESMSSLMQNQGLFYNCWVPMLTRSGRLISNSTEMSQGEFTESLLSALEQQKVVLRFSLIFEQQLKCHLDPVTKIMTDAINSLTQTVTQLKGELKTRDDTIRSLQSEVTELQTRVEDLKQHGRRDSVRIFSIPEDEPGSTDDKVLRLFNKRLKLDPPLDLDDIACHERKEEAQGTCQPTSRGQHWGRGHPYLD